ncbi:MAG: hypothetical protein NTV52_21430 [Acidobacteria bacterium]|nr:hypothetical protein [Acidobacteriota bacterium]
MAAPPVAIGVVGFTSKAIAVPGPVSVLQLTVIGVLGVTETWACARPVVNTAKSITIHTVKEGVHKASTLKRRIISNGIFIDNILFVDIDSAPSSRERPMFHCHRKPYRRDGIEHEECFRSSQDWLRSLRKQKSGTVPSKASVPLLSAICLMIGLFCQLLLQPRQK